MPRHARLIINNCPHHIIQRGHNRQVVFARDDDYRYYLETLQEWKSKLGCKVYAYCLMTNHIHLVINPGAQVENLGLLMKALPVVKPATSIQWKKEAVLSGKADLNPAQSVPTNTFLPVVDMWNSIPCEPEWLKSLGNIHGQVVRKRPGVKSCHGLTQILFI